MFKWLKFNLKIPDNILEMKICILSLILMLISKGLYSQEQLKALQIGDVIPNFEFELVNHSSSRASMADFRGKFLLLDFWATWCTSCILKFPQLDSLQRKYDNKSFQVLLVNTKNTNDTKLKVESFFQKRKTPGGNRYILPSIINDTITEKLFPHQMVPHYVLVDKSGVIRAITSSDQITELNINAFLMGKHIDLTLKRDMDFDFNKPLFVDGNGGYNEKYMFRSLLTGYLQNVASNAGTVFKNGTDSITRFYMTNTSVFMLYGAAYPEIFTYPLNRFQMRVGNMNKYHKRGDWSDWKIDNAVTYELIIPPSTEEQMLTYMRSDLKRYFNLKVLKEKRRVKCMVVKRGKDIRKLIAKDVQPEINFYQNDREIKILKNYPISELFAFFNSSFSFPFVDETNIKEKVTIELPKNFMDIDSLKAKLATYGLILTQEERELEFITLYE